MDFGKPFQNDLKRGSLLRDEEDLLSVRKRFRDDICDRLAFAGSRRTLHNKADPEFREKNCFFLT